MSLVANTVESRHRRSPARSRASARREREPAKTPVTSPVVVVEFESPSGGRWSAVGGGTSIREAIAFARESCPAGPAWEPVRWQHLFGE